MGGKVSRSGRAARLSGAVVSVGHDVRTGHAAVTLVHRHERLLFPENREQSFVRHFVQMVQSVMLRSSRPIG